MGFWTLKYKNDCDADFGVVEVAGSAGVPPYFDQITTDQFIGMEIFATHSDESEVTFYKPCHTRDWQRIQS